MTFGILLPAILGRLMWSQTGQATLLAAIVIGLPLLAGVVCFFWFYFRWKPKCPSCKAGRVSFVKVLTQERLKCNACDFNEPTGWSYD